MLIHILSLHFPDESASQATRQEEYKLNLLKFYIQTRIMYYFTIEITNKAHYVSWTQYNFCPKLLISHLVPYM